jgi:hypothetical protein
MPTPWKRRRRRRLIEDTHDLGSTDADVSGDWLIGALPRSMARLRRLQAAHAPGIVIEWERQLIRRVLAQLSPAQAFAILGRWRELHHHLEHGSADVGAWVASTRPN